MKKLFEEAELELILFGQSDIIVTSDVINKTTGEDESEEEEGG